MILAAIYPEKFEGEKGLNLMKVVLILISWTSCAILSSLSGGPSTERRNEFHIPIQIHILMLVFFFFGRIAMPVE